VIGVLGIAAMFVICSPCGSPRRSPWPWSASPDRPRDSVEAAFGIVGTEMWNIFSSYGLTVIPCHPGREIVHYAGYNPPLRPTYSGSGISARARHDDDHGLGCVLASPAPTRHGGDDERVAIPAMKQYRYHPMLNAGSVPRGRRWGPHPASIVLVVYGLYTGQSIGKLFFGNISPAPS